MERGISPNEDGNGCAGWSGTLFCTGASFAQSVFGQPSPKKIVLPDGTSPKVGNTLQLAVLRDIRILEAIYASVAQGGQRVTV